MCHPKGIVSSNPGVNRIVKALEHQKRRNGQMWQVIPVPKRKGDKSERTYHDK